MTPEGKVKEQVKRLLEEFSAFHNWPVPGGYGESFLDCFGSHNGRFFAVETKATGKKMTPRQEFIKERIEESGGRVFIIGTYIYTDDAGREVEYSGMADLREWLKRK